MMKELHIFLICILTVFSCEKSLEVDLPEIQHQSVICSELFQDSAISIQVYRTSLVNENRPNLCYIDSAMVNVYEEDVFIETLSLESHGKYIGRHRVKANTSYQVNVEVTDLKAATANTTTLNRVEIIKIDSLGLVMNSENKEIYYKFSIHFKDKKDITNYYMVDFSETALPGCEASQIYSEDRVIEVKDESHTRERITEYGNYYFSDELFNGEEYAFTFCVPLFKVYEGFTVNLSNITPEYFKYVQTFNAQGASKGLSVFYQPVQVYSNIHNGLGVLGALSTHTVIYQSKNSENEGNYINISK